MNPIKGETLLKLKDGREFKLVLDHEALFEAEIAYGKPLALLLAHAMVGFASASRAMLYGALRANHSELTLKDAGGIYFADQEAVEAALSTAAELSMPKGDGDAEGKQGSRPPRRRAGKNSGASGAKRASSRKGSGGQPRARSRSSSPPG